MSFIAWMSRIKGVVLVLLAGAVVIWDCVEARIWEGGAFEPRILAEHLIGIGLSLEAFQVGVQRYVDPDVWDDFFVPTLLTPSLYLLAALGAALLILGLILRPSRR